ncbi:RNA polymerase, sigma-24 subunit, ECF subfamily [Candidatus Sulfopaludibacter sp. SbA4]|nr:RNA polymerase, sigma-24 subunit, ECF subfamily [Candidatus Sulfopaludibacter sp. SbA4]
MQTLEHANKSAAEIYWLVFLLTGHRAPSLDVTLEALGFQDGTNPFFSAWMVAWSRRVVIAKALSAIRDELAASGRRTESSRTEKAGLTPRNWSLDGDTTRAQIESALLAIDVLPRCALLLTIFEGESLEDAAVLLDAGRDLVRKAQIIGLRELTRNLARMQGWTSAATRPYVLTNEMQHA